MTARKMVEKKMNPSSFPLIFFSYFSVPHFSVEEFNQKFLGHEPVLTPGICTELVCVRGNVRIRGGISVETRSWRRTRTQQPVVIVNYDIANTHFRLEICTRKGH